ncbi:hypothetical protein D9M69_538930 [compost metagenome]
MKALRQVAGRLQKLPQLGGCNPPRCADAMRPGQRQRRAAAGRHVVDQEEGLDPRQRVLRSGRDVDMPVQTSEGRGALKGRGQQQLRVLDGGRSAPAQAGDAVDQRRRHQRFVHAGHLDERRQLADLLEDGEFVQRAGQALSTGQGFQALDLIEQLLPQARDLLVRMEAFQPHIALVGEEVGVRGGHGLKRPRSRSMNAARRGSKNTRAAAQGGHG